MIKTIHLHLAEQDVADSKVLVSDRIGGGTPLVSVFFHPFDYGTVSITFPNYAAFQGWLNRMQRVAVDEYDEWVNRDLCGGGDLPEAA